jgi:hypothetical protein
VVGGAAAAELEAVHALHAAEVVRASGFVRSREEMRRIYGLPGVLTLLWSGGAWSAGPGPPAAYLLLGGIQGARGRRGGRALLHHALARWGTLVRPGDDAAVGALPSGRTADTDTGGLGEALGGYMARELGAALPVCAYAGATTLGDVLEAAVPSPTARARGS